MGKYVLEILFHLFFLMGVVLRISFFGGGGRGACRNEAYCVNKLTSLYCGF